MQITNPKSRGSIFTWGECYQSGESETGRLVAAKWATAGGAGGLDIGVFTFQEILSLLDWEEDQQREDEVAAVALFIMWLEDSSKVTKQITEKWISKTYRWSEKYMYKLVTSRLC